MQPNKKQIKVCKIISDQAEFWKGTNDITSPTHGCDIGETLNNSVLFDELTDSEADELETKLIDLLCFVRSLKE